MHLVALLVSGWLSLAAGPPDCPPDVARALRLHQIQVVGTHNSYHLRPPQGLLKSMIAIRKDAREWDYSRQRLDEQLDQGVRSFELDLHLMGNEWLVMHVPTFDAGTTVRSLREALEVVAAWSDRHPRHVPISFLVELKEEGTALSGKFRAPAAADLDRLDEEIRAVFTGHRLLTPDRVRGEAASLETAIREHGWPTLLESAGTVLVVLHELGKNRELYLAGHESLRGRAMFVNSNPGEPHAATLVLDNPADPEIPARAAEGYLIRTRADAQGDLAAERRSRALASGAQILSTDYPVGEIEPERAFSLAEGAPARVNPVTGPAEQAEAMVREPLEAP